MTSAFDPQVFLDAQQTEVNERRPPLPVENPEDTNGLYTAVIGEIKMASGTIGKGERVGQPWVQAIVPLKIQVPASQQAAGIPAELTITDRPMLDLTPSGSIDNAKGKNNAQRRYREAVNLNKAGEPFSWRMMQGKVVKVKINHKDLNGSIVEEIAAVFPS